jgi:hypothetical protein
MPSDTSGVGGERPARLEVRLLGVVEVILDGRHLRAFNSLWSRYGEARSTAHDSRSSSGPTPTNVRRAPTSENCSTTSSFPSRHR